MKKRKIFQKILHYKYGMKNNGENILKHSFYKDFIR